MTAKADCKSAEGITVGLIDSSAFAGCSLAEVYLAKRLLKRAHKAVDHRERQI
jgi:hypothetical protein